MWINILEERKQTRHKVLLRIDVPESERRIFGTLERVAFFSSFFGFFRDFGLWR
jgi:hypothetical protein